jgi:DNA repair protein RadC
MENVITEIQLSYNTNCRVKQKIVSSESAYELLLNHWGTNTIELQEEFKVLLLNKANCVLGIYNLSKGSTTSTLVDIKLIAAVAIKSNASSIIVCHNHPSGNFNPSETDKSITKKLKLATELFEITLLDHLIITKNGYYSFKDNGIL